MSATKRKFLFCFFVLAFLLIATWVTFYAQGYRFNLTWPPNFNQVLQRNGMILIETDPNGAKILLDGKVPKSFLSQYLPDSNEPVRTDAKLRNIIPGEYILTLELDNYHTWERKIEVQPGKITIISDLRLIRKDLPWQLVNQKIDQKLISPDKKIGLNILDNQIVDLNSGNSNPATIPNLTATSSVSWSPNNNKVLLDKKVFDVNQAGVELNLEKIIEPEATNLKWGRSENQIYYTNQNSLNSFDLSSKTDSQFLTREKEILNYFPEENYLFLITKKNGSAILEVISYTNSEAIKSIEFPFSPNYDIKSTPNNDIISVYDQYFDILYLIEPLSPISVLKESLNNVKYFSWKNNQEIVYGNDYEVWKFNLRNYEKRVILRFSSEIEKALAVPSTNKIIYYDQSSIKLVDLNQEKINITELITLSHISDLSLGTNREILYFNAEIGQQSGLYKLNLY